MSKNTVFTVSNQIGFEHIWDINSGQDGAIYGDYLFRFDHNGSCRVYSMTKKQKVSTFMLDQLDVVTPHSNAVCFGSEFYEAGDEFPLLYSNIYNNYSREANRLEGVCCVYRLIRNGNTFHTKLIQLIKIGFVDHLDYWKSMEGTGDVRPYGNFLVDTDHNRLLAFTMRDAEKVTRYFAFDLPKATDGIYSELYQANVVTLEMKDIRLQFDCEYSNYLQGACYYDNKIFSVEGFTGPDIPARLQVIDLAKQVQCAAVNLFSLGLDVEPEFIDVYNGVLYYGDGHGRLFTIQFC